MFAEPELERALLQTLWQEAAHLGPVYGRNLLERAGLVADDFTEAKGRELFGALCESLATGRLPLLAKDDRAARAYLATEQVRPATKLDAMADRLKSLTVRRALSRAAREIHQLAGEEELPASEVVAKAKALLAATPQRESSWEDLGGAVSRVEKHLREVADGKRQPCIPTGFDEIDAATGGLPATLVVIVAMPGVGKSAWVGSIIRNIASSGQKVAIFSMEDASEWLAFRFLAHESGVSQGALRRKPLSADEWNKAATGLHEVGKLKANVLVDDRESLTPAAVLSASRDAINRGARAIFLDNMTAMRLPRGERRDLEFQDFLVAARALANETGVPFVVISHAKRREGLDVNDLPMLTDCAESSAYEKLCRLAYGLARSKKDDSITVGVLKNTNGRAWQKFSLVLRTDSALVETERRQNTPPRAWDWSKEVSDGTL